ncbi:uncharacterized protein ACO6RY_09468 [Pungitius sinensis]
MPLMLGVAWGLRFHGDRGS